MAFSIVQCRDELRYATIGKRDIEEIQSENQEKGKAYREEEQGESNQRINGNIYTASEGVVRMTLDVH